MALCGALCSRHPLVLSAMERNFSLSSKGNTTREGWSGVAGWKILGEPGVSGTQRKETNESKELFFGGGYFLLTE